MTDADERRTDQPHDPGTSTRGGGVAIAGRRIGAAPIILIALGVLLLAGNLGWFGWGQLIRLLSFWPVALIAVGVDLLTAGRYRTMVAAAAVVAVLALWGSDLGTRGGGWFALAPGSPAATTVAVRHDLEGATAGRVELDLGVGQVRVDGAAPSGVLVAGTIQTGAGEAVREASDVSGGVKRVQIASEQARGINVGRAETRRWELSLTREVPVTLTVAAGVGQTTLDLSQVQLAGITYRGGVGESRVTLPAGSYDGSLDMGVGSSTIDLPRAAAVRVTVAAGLGRVNVTGGLRRDGNVYTSEGFESASERITLRVNGGIGSIDVNYR